jgi:hypothetical protein
MIKGQDKASSFFSNEDRKREVRVRVHVRIRLYCLSTVFDKSMSFGNVKISNY